METDDNRVDTKDRNFQNWTIKMPIALLGAIIFGLWHGFTVYTLIHDNEKDIKTINRRIDTKHDRQQKDIEELRKVLHDLECQ